MSRHVIRVTLIALMSCAPAAFAQDHAGHDHAPTTAPAAHADAPATAPTTAEVIPANQDTPRGALKMLTKAMENGDAEGIRAVLHATTPSEQKMADIMAEMAGALAKMRKAAVGAFGQENSKGLGGDPRAAAAAMGRIDSAVEKIDGDTATVAEGSGQGQGVTLVRVDRKWRVPMTDMLAGAKPAEIDQKLAEIGLQAKVIGETADDMAAGKFKTAEDAMQSLRNKIMKQQMQQQQEETGATQPATAPAVAPTTAPANDF